MKVLIAPTHDVDDGKQDCLNAVPNRSEGKEGKNQYVPSRGELDFVWIFPLAGMPPPKQEEDIPYECHEKYDSTCGHSYFTLMKGTPLPPL